MTKRRGLAFALIAATALLWPQDGRAQADYPNQPIKMIVPFAPAGASDFVARLTQRKLAEILGRDIIIENRPGAAGNIGTEVAARAAPDGYTLFLGNVGTIGLNPYVFKDLRIKPLEDFIPVSIMADMPSVFVVNKSFAPSTVKELIDLGKANPGKLNFASPGSGSLDRMVMELFRSEAGLDMNHIPYKGGAAPAATDVVAGHVPMMFGTSASTIPHVKGGTLKALTVTSKERIAALPNVPTIVEAGFPDVVASSWQGLLVPAGTPRPIVQKLHAAIVQAMKDPEIIAKLADVGGIATSSASPEAFRDYIKTDSAKWQRVIVNAKIVPD